MQYNGILFLEQVVSLKINLGDLRQPLEDGEVHFRSAGKVTLISIHDITQ